MTSTDPFDPNLSWQEIKKLPLDIRVERMYRKVSSTGQPHRTLTPQPIGEVMVVLEGDVPYSKPVYPAKPPLEASNGAKAFIDLTPVATVPAVEASPQDVHRQFWGHNPVG